MEELKCRMNLEGKEIEDLYNKPSIQQIANAKSHVARTIGEDT